jgi:flavin reductase (DIM6/NTAB) family NADH-FMN oxidoreductase RutF|tara:strand:+ start:2060 stop:2677 length:618 start_codon:yes stop_codon:yes gene_type:complete
MVHFNKNKIKNLEKIYRLNLINSCTGYKSANLLGSMDNNGNTNLAIFSSITHLGSDPAMIGFVLRPRTVPRNTYNNMFNTKYFTVNHVNANDIEDAHHTSAKYPKEISEFEKTKFEPEFIDNFKAPFVKSSKIKFGCKYLNEYDIKENNTIMVVASIECLFVDDDALQNDGWIRLDKAETVTINGLDGYAKTSLIKRYEYARPKK